jgi:cytidylate kinase
LIFGIIIAGVFSANVVIIKFHLKTAEILTKSSLVQLKKRDENDLKREDALLKIAPDVIAINNGNLTIDEGFYKILQIINS